MKIIALSLELRQPKLRCCRNVLSFRLILLKFLQRVEFQHLYNGTFYDRKRYDRKGRFYVLQWNVCVVVGLPFVLLVMCTNRS